LGASIDDLVRGCLHDGDHIIVSGPWLTGRETQYLGRGHLQIIVQPAGGRVGRWKLAPRGGAIGPIIPVAGHQQAFPFDLPAVPILRALAVGDSETAKTLGCLELLEEDVAVLSYVCPSGNDYAPLLRVVLDELRQGL
jgi:Na+-transporting NADH:ubiquinone oxidoreductase subunit A